MHKLYTADGEALQGQPWSVYPRPQLRRNSFICLNGEWEFAVTEGNEPPAVYDRRILVPFAPESLLSGIDEVFPENMTRWYHRCFPMPTDAAGKRVLLHFGAVDQQATVFVNGAEVGSHDGGYEAFTLDVTAYLREENTLTVAVIDRLSEQVFPYGKQSVKRGGMWYTPVSGIWQTVWLEVVPQTYIRDLKLHITADAVDIVAEGATDGIVTMDGKPYPLRGGRVKITPEQPHRWSPEDPYLYDFSVTCGEDTVHSYFALREVSVREVDGKQRLCLNGKPYFFHGLLDQGYWSDGLFTPATPTQYADDIRAMKALGFNMLRKHIKVEPEQFYYDCDRLGMVVFQDMVNNGDYNFLRDTALPTVGLLRRDDRRLHRDPATRRAFEEGMEATVWQLYNHPCICYWTVFNEGWGQFDSEAMTNRLRTLDSSRLIDSTSGWFLGDSSDVDSRHIYFRKVKLKAGNKPLVLSEFGGYSWKPEGHVFNTEQTYGYGKCRTREEFVAAVRQLYEQEILPLIPQGLCATVYTQVSDVEDETNGLLSYDRKVQKILPEEFADLSVALLRKASDINSF